MVEITKMDLEHIDGVMTVEHLSFTVPWSREAFIREISTNNFAHYLVALKENIVVGYAGMWKIQDEGHITNIAVHPDHRREHIGKKLLEDLIDMAKSLDITAMTLEVRNSNTPAQKLYEGFGFCNAGIRKKYYSDNKEDAIIMWNESI